MGKVCSVLNNAAKFDGYSLKKSLPKGPDLLQNLIHLILRFVQLQFAVSTDIDGMFLQVGVPDCDQPSLRFCSGKPHKKLLSVPIHAQCIRDQDSPTYALQSMARGNIRQRPEASKAVLKTFTWTTAENRWNPLREFSLDRRNWRIFFT